MPVLWTVSPISEDWAALLEDYNKCIIIIT